MHLSGEAPGPALPFGFSIGPYAKESEWSKLTKPEHVAARTLLLDYFFAQQKVVRPDHVIFDWEASMQVANSSLLCSCVVLHELVLSFFCSAAMSAR